VAAEKERAVLQTVVSEGENAFGAPLTAFASADARAAFRGPIETP
jgi:hypothetical protein